MFMMEQLLEPFLELAMYCWSSPSWHFLEEKTNSILNPVFVHSSHVFSTFPGVFLLPLSSQSILLGSHGYLVFTYPPGASTPSFHWPLGSSWPSSWPLGSCDPCGSAPASTGLRSPSVTLAGLPRLGVPTPRDFYALRCPHGACAPLVFPLGPSMAAAPSPCTTKNKSTEP
eukprot:Gb_25167 [translate_table: standard]